MGPKKTMIYLRRSANQQILYKRVRERKMNRNKICYLPLLFILLFRSSYAQQKSIDSLNMEVFNPFKPTIADAVKINDNPVNTDSTSRIPAQRYSVSPKPMVTNFDVSPIQPAQMLGEPLNRLYNSFVKIAGGLYNTFNGEGFYNSLRSKDYSYGIHVNSLSSESTLPNSGYSGYSDNLIDLYGKKFYNNSTFYGDLDYERNVVHYYGYNITDYPDINANSTLQRFSYISPGLRWVSHYADSTHLNYDATIKYFNLMALPNLNENNVFGAVTAGRYWHQQWVYLDLSVNYYNTSNSIDTVNHTIFRAIPGVDFKDKSGKWKLKLSLPLVCDFSKEITPGIFPTVHFDYNVLDNTVIPYAGIGGGYDSYDYKTMTDINPFLSPTASLQNTSRYDGFLGIRGSIDKNTSYNLKATYAFVDNMSFFVTDTDPADFLQNKFILVYDKVQYFNLHGEIAYQGTRKLKLFAKADYNHYQMTNELRPWYKPVAEITLSAHYNLADKIIVKADLFFIGKQLAETFGSNGGIIIKPLPGMEDINLSVEYNYSKLFSFFLNFDNIANDHYYRWNNYPTQGFLLMGGLYLTIL
jgi:hypothetical protein